ncbi:MAG: formylglycine-generating enzyme family protein [Anaerolineae bacterium]|nr:formylglycine-generating enzyme family protein [Anaerolineae bacterium]
MIAQISLPMMCFKRKLFRSLNLPNDAPNAPPPNTMLPSVTIPADDVLSILPPPFAWCPIPAGQVTIEGKTYDVPAFEMAKYPVTNAQFRVFIDADDGYRYPVWWEFSEEAKAWHNRNTRPLPTAFDGEDHPRANVSWYEAIAFCCWLAARLRIEPEQPAISLPTELQWQLAAVGDTGWDYPWGPVFDLLRCNSSVGGKSNGTSPVSAYETKGDSPFGVVDMTGNIWEWCRNLRDDIASDNLQGQKPRMLRGGSWRNNNSQILRAAYRGDGAPYSMGYDWGFRVARTIWS